MKGSNPRRYIGLVVFAVFAFWINSANAGNDHEADVETVVTAARDDAKTANETKIALITTDEKSKAKKLEESAEAVADSVRPLRKNPIDSVWLLLFTWPWCAYPIFFSLLVGVVVNEFNAGLQRVASQFGWVGVVAAPLVRGVPWVTSLVLICLAMYFALGVSATAADRMLSGTPEIVLADHITRDADYSEIEKALNQQEAAAARLEGVIETYRGITTNHALFRTALRNLTLFSITVVVGVAVGFFGWLQRAEIAAYLQNRPRPCAFCLDKTPLDPPGGEVGDQGSEVPRDSANWDIVLERWPRKPEIASTTSGLEGRSCRTCGMLVDDDRFPIARIGIAGPPGSGKTRMCAAWLDMAHHNQLPAELHAYGDAINTFDHAFSDRDGRWAEKLRDYKDGKAHTADQKTDKTLEPLVFRASRSSRPLRYDYDVAISDTSGELYSQITETSHPERQRLIQQSFHVITVPVVSNTSDVTVAELAVPDLDHFKRLISNFDQANQKRWFHRQPIVALVLTKIDCLRTANGKTPEVEEGIETFYKELKKIDEDANYYYWEKRDNGYNQAITLDFLEQRSEATLELMKCLWPRWNVDKEYHFGDDILCFPTSGVNLIDEEMEQPNLALSRRASVPYGIWEALVWGLSKTGHVKLVE